MPLYVNVIRLENKRPPYNLYRLRQPSNNFADAIYLSGRLPREDIKAIHQHRKLVHPGLVRQCR